MKEKPQLTLEEELYRVGFCFLVAGAISCFILVKWIFPILPPVDCFFWKYLGIYCPGCGGTRAVIAFCHGQFLLSLWYHPIVVYIAATFGWFMLSHTLEKIHFPFVNGIKFHEELLYGALVVIAVNFVAKNVLKFCFGIMM